MKGLAICHKGIEDIAEKEIEEIIDEAGTVEERAIIFNADTEKLAKLAYMGRSIKRVLAFLGKAKINSRFEDIVPLLQQLVKESKSAEWLQCRTFKVEAKRIGEHDFTSQDVVEKIGELFLEKHTKDGTKVAMENPQVIVFVFINQNVLYLGIEVSGFDLSKREYKLFSTGASINSSVAYALARIAKVKQKETILDPFCNAGVIPIEIALYLKNLSTNFYRKDKMWFSKVLHIDAKQFDNPLDPEVKIIEYDRLMNFMQATKKNAQIAGVNKLIYISRADIEWLDTKQEEKSIDKIVTRMPSLSKTFDKKGAEKLYKEFFYKAEFILADKGKIAFIIDNDEFFK